MFNRISARDKIEFFEELSFLLNSDFTLVDSLNTLKKEKKKLKIILSDIVDDIEGGMPFSKSVSLRGKKVFPSVVTYLLETAEQTGKMGETCNNIASNLKYNEAIKSKIVGALAYPAVVFIIGMGVGLFLTVTIIPKFSQQFKGKGIALPLSTEILLGFSDFIIQNYITIIISVIVIIIATIILWQIEASRVIMELFLLKIPVIGKMLTYIATSQISATISVLLASDIKLIEALRITANISSFKIFKNKINESRKSVLLGIALSDSLKTRLLPGNFFELMKVGEKTGNLASILGKIGIYYEEKVKVSIDTMTKMIEPVMMIVLGTLVGTVYFAFFQSLMKLQTST